MTDDPLNSAFASLEPGPDARRRMRLAVLEAVEADQTSLFTVWWRALTGQGLGGRAMILAAVLVVLFTSPALAVPLAVARRLVPEATELATVWQGPGCSDGGLAHPLCVQVSPTYPPSQHARTSSVP